MSDKKPDDDLIGRTIAGRYRIISRLGAGGMGVAYRAWDEDDGVPVVIKIPKKAFLDDPKFAERFAREIRLLQGLRHPHIVPIVDVGEHEGLPYVAMRFLPGGSLSDRRLRDEDRKTRPNPPGMLHLWLPAIAAALDHVHSNGVVHRDVKPGNIFFDAFWGAFLGDFGIAKIVEESESFDREHTLTATNMGIGTQEYMGPEQFTPKPFLDGRSDQYALAVMVYEMLAGTRPFTGTTAHLIVEVTTMPVPRLDRQRTGLPASLVQAVHRGLAKNPRERFSTCREFAYEVLRDVPLLADEPDIARLLCPKCSNILKLPVAAAGQRGKCPKCQTQMKVADDLGALWLLDEARRQRRSQATVVDVQNIEDDQEPGETGSEIDEEALEAFKPVSSTTPIWSAARKQGKKASTGMIIGGVAAAVVTLAGLLVIFGGGGGPKPPEPPPKSTYEQEFAKAEEKVGRDPDDKAANDFLGRHWCFKKDDWKKGLPYLAKSGAIGLWNTAKKQLDLEANPAAGAGDKVQLVKDWWTLAGQKGFVSVDEAKVIKQHAAGIYAAAVDGLTDAKDIEDINRWLERNPEFLALAGGKRPPEVEPGRGEAPKPRWLAEAMIWEKNGHAYKVFKETLSWSQAKQRCEELGGHLVSITSREERQFVHSVIATAGIPVDNRPGLAMWQEKLWAGGTDEGSEGKWRWVDGSPWEFAPWLPQQPDNDGDFLNVCPHYGGGWNDDQAVGTFVTGFICEWPKQPVIPKPKPAPSVAESEQSSVWVADLPVTARKSQFFHNRVSWEPIGDKKYANTIHIHPEVGSGKSQLVYQIDGKYDEIGGAIGVLDMAKRVASPQVFRIVGDGKELWKSAPFKQTGKGEDFRVNVSGVKTLELLTECAGSKFDAHCVWIEPQLATGDQLPTQAVPLVSSAVLFPCGEEIKPSPTWQADIRDLYEPEKRDAALKRLVAASPYFGADEVKKPVRYVVVTPTSGTNAMILVLCGHGDSSLDPNNPRPTGHLFVFNSAGGRVRYSANVLKEGDLVADIFGDGMGYMCQRILIGAGGVTKTQMRVYRLDENMREGRTELVATYDEPVPMTFICLQEKSTRCIAVFESPQKRLATIKYDRDRTWTSDNAALRVDVRR